VRLILVLAASLLLTAPASAAAGRRADAERVLKRAEAALEGRGVRSGFDLTPLLLEVRLRMPDLAGRELERARGVLERPTKAGGFDFHKYSVRQERPLCGAHVCVHWVATTRDAPPRADADGDGVPDYVERVHDVMEHVHQVENVGMGWREPVGDGRRGTEMNKTDLYLSQIGDEGHYGYAVPDPDQRLDHSQFAYLVLDNDFSEFPEYGGPLPLIQVTAAHEYNHVLQYAYDTAADRWFQESTAAWIEDKVYDGVNDYRQYVTSWARLPHVPLTSSGWRKFYGDLVWNRWLDSRYGPEMIREAWARSARLRPRSFAPGAYDSALRRRGTTFSAAFSRFAADTAEWRADAGAFDEGGPWPDVFRGGTLKLGTGIYSDLDHTSYSLIDVVAPQAPRIRLVGWIPRGLAGAIALVGRRGSATGGAVTVRIKRPRAGGLVRVDLARPSAYTRITAVLVNASIAHDGGFSKLLFDWDFRKVDDRRVDTYLTTDFVAPAVRHRTPRPRERGVPRRARVAVRFSEQVYDVSERSLRLITPDGRAEPARVSYDPRTHTARLTPESRLAARTRYRVKLKPTISDLGYNSVPVRARSWSFRTGS
jgi:hypothetical protein